MKCLFLLVFVVACATTPSRPDIQHTFNYRASFENVWTALVDVFSDLDLPIEILEKDSGRINTEWFDIEADTDFVDCGRQTPGELSFFSGRISVVAREEGEAMEVDITSTFRAAMREPADNRSYEIRCYSTGGWETLVSTHLQERIGGSGGR